jgi:opacity protein-like surface antigen
MNRILFLVLLCLFFITNQTITQPKLTLHISGGYSPPLPDLKGNLPLNTGENDYGMSSGFNLGADGVYTFDKKGYIGALGTFSYNMFSNTGDYPLLSTTQTVKINILTLGLGMQFNLPKIKKFRPFVSGEFTTNFFSGKTLIEAVDTLPTTENPQKSETRFGLQFGAGTEIMVDPEFGFVLGIKYHLANLIGKDSASVSEIEYALDDSQHLYNGMVIPAKKIQYLQVYAGVSIYLLQPRVKRK